MSGKVRNTKLLNPPAVSAVEGCLFTFLPFDLFTLPAVSLPAVSLSNGRTVEPSTPQLSNVS